MRLIVDAANVIATVSSFLIFIPQALVAWRVRKDPVKLQGISATGQWFILISETAWLILGYDLHSFAVAASWFLNAPLSTIVLILVYRSRFKNWLKLRREGSESARSVSKDPNLSDVQSHT